MNIFDIVLINPILNILVVIYQLLTALHVPSALGFSIVLLTVVIRLILSPFMHQSLKQQKKTQALTHHVNKIKEKHKADAKRQQAEIMALYKAEGVNPASGCVFLIIQIPILIGLYNVLLKAVHIKSINDINHVLYSSSLRINHMWDTHFFGVPLASSPAQLIHTAGPIVLLVSVFTAVFQLIQSRMMMQKPAPGVVVEQKKKSEPDFATAMQQQTMYIFPLMIAFLSYNYPFGLSLYWNTLTIFGIIQQYIATGWGGLVDWLPFLKPKEVSKYK